MPSLVLRVAARHRASMMRQAVFIPDKFFKGFEAEFKKLLTTSLQGKPLEETPWLITNDVIPLFKRFVKELSERAPQAQETLRTRLETRVRMLEKLAASYSAARRAIESPYPQVTPLDRVRLYIEVTANDKLEKLLPTLGKAFSLELTIDPDKVKALAQKALKKATPEELAAIVADQDWSNETLRVKYEFYQKHIDKSIPRLIKKQKVEQTFLTWFDFIRRVLEANYTGESETLYSEFDLNGMKVVIDDRTVTPKQQAEYVKYLKETYHRLKAKKLGRAWYGTVFIQCEKCGGFNPNTGAEDVAGHYFIGQDFVRIYSRPGKSTVHIMAHELGHRYWFKSMSSTQRGKFESLVRAHKGPRPEGPVPKPLDPSQLERARKDAIGLGEEALHVLGLFQKTRLTEPEEAVGHFEDRLSRVGWSLGELVNVAVRPTSDLDAGGKGLFQDVQDAVGKAKDHLAYPREMHRVASDAASFAKAKAVWISEAEQLVHTAVAATVICMNQAFMSYNEREMAKMTDAQKQRQKDWDTDPRGVVPVSDYGKSNIDEAFAEVFSHYVLDWRMSADQEASFRAVLLNEDRTAARVASRWLARREGYRVGAMSTQAVDFLRR